jgi:uncharacterized protein (DUF924 family)
MANSESEALVRFWRDAGKEAWFKKDEAFDERFRAEFGDAHWRAAARQCDGWIETAEGALALILLLDQFPRNCFRGTAHMFATDPLARYFADSAIARGHDRNVEDALASFFYLPFEHSEALADQDRSMALFSRLDADTLKWAEQHRDIIRRFGRFPHRNTVLGRETTAEERAFLDGGGFSG